VLTAGRSVTALLQGLLNAPRLRVVSITSVLASLEDLTCEPLDGAQVLGAALVQVTSGQGRVIEDPLTLVLPDRSI
jgi:hypothetical protein